MILLCAAELASAREGHFGCFLILVTTNKAVVDILLKLFVWTSVWPHFGKYQRAPWVGTRVEMCLTFVRSPCILILSSCPA